MSVASGTFRKSARRLLAEARRKADEAFHKIKTRVVRHFADGNLIESGRIRPRSGSYELLQRTRTGPNTVHVCIARAVGGYDELGL